MRRARLISELTVAAIWASLSHRAIRTAGPRFETPDVIGSLATISYTPPERHGNGWLDITWPEFGGQKPGTIRVGLTPETSRELTRQLIRRPA